VDHKKFVYEFRILNGRVLVDWAVREAEDLEAAAQKIRDIWPDLADLAVVAIARIDDPDATDNPVFFRATGEPVIPHK
jgi:hypothetical protein